MWPSVRPGSEEDVLVIGEGFRPRIEVKKLDESAEQRGFATAILTIDQQILASEIEGVCAWAREGTKVLDLDFRESHASPAMMRTVSSEPSEKRQLRIGWFKS